MRNQIAHIHRSRGPAVVLIVDVQLITQARQRDVVGRRVRGVILHSEVIRAVAGIRKSQFDGVSETDARNQRDSKERQGDSNGL